MDIILNVFLPFDETVKFDNNSTQEFGREELRHWQDDSYKTQKV
jgi:hypothetical protein